jgi:hypothetical protein
MRDLFHLGIKYSVSPYCGLEVRAPLLRLAIATEAGIISTEMSGIFFDLPSVRFLRRSRFFETMMRTFASSLRRWLSAPACGLRQVYFRLDEAEFSAASQNGYKLVDWTLDGSRAADSVPNARYWTSPSDWRISGALCLFNNWIKLKDQHELLFIRATPAPFAWRRPTQRQLRSFSGSTRISKDSEKDILAAGGRIFWKWRCHKEERTNHAQRHPTFSPATQT